jgi:hypothetical protein
MGRAYYKFNVSIAANMVDPVLEEGQLSHTDIEVSRVHSQLPYKTKLISIEKNMKEIGLHIGMVAIFEHPVFKDDVEIKDTSNYTRSIGFNGKEEIIAINTNSNLNFDEFIRSYEDIQGEK